MRDSRLPSSRELSVLTADTTTNYRNPVAMATKARASSKSILDQATIAPSKLAPIRLVYASACAAVCATRVNYYTPLELCLSAMNVELRRQLGGADDDGADDGGAGVVADMLFKHESRWVTVMRSLAAQEVVLPVRLVDFFTFY